MGEVGNEWVIDFLQLKRLYAILWDVRVCK